MESNGKATQLKKQTADCLLNWNKLNASGYDILGIEGHCSTTIGNSVYTFGGVVIDKNNVHENNELWKFSLDTQQWTKVVAKNAGPSPRTAACMAAVGNKLYIFGGMSLDQGWLNDLHCLNLDKNEWSTVKPKGNPPCARDKCSCTTIDNKIYFFGGFGPGGTQDDEEDDDEDEDEEDEGVVFGWFNDLHVLDCTNDEALLWHAPVQLNLMKPSPRAAVAMASVGSVLYIFGGRDKQGRQNDLHAFDTNTKKWCPELCTSSQGSPPNPRSFHTMNALGDKLIVFGGRGADESHFNNVDIFETASKSWLQPEMKGDIPEARGNHAASIVTNQLLVFGGSNDFNAETNACTRQFSDVHVLQF